MAFQDDVIADFMNPDEPKVTFKFPNGLELQMIKKVLIRNSDVFKVMLDEGEWAEGSKMEISIEDSTFSGSDTMQSDFKLFISAMCGRNIVKADISMSTMINVYAIAHKYQVDKIKESAISDIQWQVKMGLINDTPGLELLLKFLYTYEIRDFDLARASNFLAKCRLNVLYHVYAIAQKYRADVIKESALDYHQKAMKVSKIAKPIELEQLLQFISTYKLSGLDTFNLEITKDNYLDYLRVIKKLANVHASRQLGKFIIDNNIPYLHIPADLCELLFEIQKLMIIDKDQEIFKLKNPASQVARQA